MERAARQHCSSRSSDYRTDDTTAAEKISLATIESQSIEARRLFYNQRRILITRGSDFPSRSTRSSTVSSPEDTSIAMIDIYLNVGRPCDRSNEDQRYSNVRPMHFHCCSGPTDASFWSMQDAVRASMLLARLHSVGGRRDDHARKTDHLEAFN
jgi:hypothetical protein